MENGKASQGRTHNLSRSDWIRSVLDEYEMPLMRYALRITGDTERARDVVQDTFLKLCRENPQRIADRLAAWLFRVCRNRAFDVRKKESPMRPLDEARMETRGSDDPDPSTLVQQKETHGQVLEILAGLPRNQQEVIRLKFQEGLSYKEIAAVTRLSVSNVGFLIHVGLKAVRQELQKVIPPAEASLRRVK